MKNILILLLTFSLSINPITLEEAKEKAVTCANATLGLARLTVSGLEYLAENYERELTVAGYVVCLIGIAHVYHKADQYFDGKLDTIFAGTFAKIDEENLIFDQCMEEEIAKGADIKQAIYRCYKIKPRGILGKLTQ